MIYILRKSLQQLFREWIVGGVRGEAGRPPGRLFIQEGGSKGGREVDKLTRYAGEALTEFTDGLAVGEEKESKIMPRVLALKTGVGGCHF